MGMRDKYVLDGKKVVLAKSLEEWWRQFEDPDRIVAQTDVGEGVRVSTVFIGLDHNFDECGPPLVFETMIFGGPHDQYQTRSSTWEEAEAQHAEALALTKS